MLFRASFFSASLKSSYCNMHFFAKSKISRQHLDLSGGAPWERSQEKSIFSIRVANILRLGYDVCKDLEGQEHRVQNEEVKVKVKETIKEKVFVWRG